MTIEISEALERALEQKALAAGVLAEDYAVDLLERDLCEVSGLRPSRPGYKTSYGAAAKFGPAPSAAEIDENRREMFRNFGEDF